MKFLNLSCNNISDEGVIALANSIGGRTTGIEEINLSKNAIEDKGG